VDDGSTDNTKEVLSHYPGIIIIDQKNNGVSSARNAGIEQANGEWLAFLDSDDEWLPVKLEKQWAAICNDDKLICHTEEIWIRNGQRVNPMKKHQKFGKYNILFRANYLLYTNLRRKLWKKNMKLTVTKKT